MDDDARPPAASLAVHQLSKAPLVDPCSARWQIFKRPLHTKEDVAHLLALRRTHPRLRLVIIHRDLPSTVWSILQRHGATGDDKDALAYAHGTRRHYCEVELALAAASASWDTELDWHMTLHEFSRNSSALAQAILRQPGAVAHEHVDRARTSRTSRGPSQHAPSAGSTMPPPTEHSTRRQWQAFAPVYADDPDAFKREAPRRVAAALAAMRCPSSPSLIGGDSKQGQRGVATSLMLCVLVALPVVAAVLIHKLRKAGAASRRPRKRRRPMNVVAAI